MARASNRSRAFLAIGIAVFLQRRGRLAAEGIDLAESLREDLACLLEDGEADRL